MLEIKKLTKYYGKILGCKNISLKIEKGEIFGFIGPNGAGKSTTIRCIMNLINKTSGEVYIDGEFISEEDYKMKEIIGYLPSEVHLYDDLTVKELLDYNAKFYKKDCKKKMNELVKDFDIDVKKKVDELSLGNGKKLGIVLALMHDPELIIMDEASSGLDPLMQEKFYEILEKEKKAGKTIFFSSHNLSEVKRLCDRIAIIKDGSIVAMDKTEKLTDTEFSIITIISTNLKKFKAKLKGKILDEKNDYIKIMFEGNINEFLKTLNGYEVSKLLVEEPSIEEIFMHYYK